MGGDPYVYDTELAQTTWDRYGTGSAYAYVHAPGLVVLAAPWALLPWPIAKVLALTAVAGSIVGGGAWMWLRWDPESLRPVWVVAALLAAATASPVHETVALGNLHALSVFATIAAFFLAARYPAIAGLILAGATAIKLTPAVLVIPWLIEGRWRALIGWAVGLLAVGTVGLAVGVESHFAWAQVVADNSARVLPTRFTQGIPGLWVRSQYPGIESLDRIPTPWALRLTGPVLTLVLGLWLWVRRNRGLSLDAPVVLTGVIGWTLIAPPLVWSHYHIALIAPAIALIARRDPIGIGGLVVLAMAQLPPIARTDWHTLALFPIFLAAMWPRGWARSGPTLDGAKPVGTPSA
jgi:alpha-1,2-mannosyltransferase